MQITPARLLSNWHATGFNLNRVRSDCAVLENVNLAQAPSRVGGSDALRCVAAEFESAG